MASLNISPAETKIGWLGTGVMGGFTTYSTFNAETLSYFSDGQPAKGVLYVALTMGVCLAAGAAGTLLGARA